METIKKQKTKYNYNYLNKFCCDNNLILLKNYSEIDINRDTFIEIKCIGENCENICNKKFKNLIDNKNFGCVNCTPKLKLLKIHIAVTEDILEILQYDIPIIEIINENLKFQTKLNY